MAEESVQICRRGIPVDDAFDLIKKIKKVGINGIHCAGTDTGIIQFQAPHGISENTRHALEQLIDSLIELFYN